MEITQVFYTNNYKIACDAEKNIIAKLGREFNSKCIDAKTKNDQIIQTRENEIKEGKKNIKFALEDVAIR